MSQCALNAEEPAEVPIKTRLRRVAGWIRNSFVAGEINLVPNMPSGKTRGGRVREDLRHLYWLQNCNLFAMTALRPYDAELSKKIERSYLAWYEKAFPGVLRHTSHGLPLGRLPELEIPEGKFLRAVVKVKDYGDYRIGTETVDPDQLGAIRPDNPKLLLKDGVLYTILAGQRQQASDYFRQAMQLWDGSGFRERRTPDGVYHTRCLAYALIAQRALGEKMPPAIGRAVEARLWSCQDDDGGLWTDYCADGTFPDHAKKTNEIAPLTLLAYDETTWGRD
jgi:hypothetical protein